MKPTLLVLAAGMGSRYGGLKQIDPIWPHGEVIIDYSVYDAIQAGFAKVVFVIRKDIEHDFKTFVGSRFEGKIPVEYVYQELTNLPQGYTVPEGRTKPRGTGHAVLMAKDVIHEPFVVINADDFYGRESFVLASQFFQRNSLDYALFAYSLAQTVSAHGGVNRGVCTVRDGYLDHIQEVKNITLPESGLDPNTPVSMNFFAFQPSFFEFLLLDFEAFLAEYGHELTSEFYIPTVLDQGIRDGKCRCEIVSTPAAWFGVTYKEDKPFVQESLRVLLDKGEYPSPLFIS